MAAGIVCAVTTGDGDWAFTTANGILRRILKRILSAAIARTAAGRRRW
jgi:hypothetical protein